MSKIKVIVKSGYHSVCAIKKILRGENILELKGNIQSFPTKYSIQTGEKSHWIPFSENSNDKRSFWRFLNHSCSPNSYFNINKMTLLSLREINAGEEISYNYCTTEYDMSSPFKCLCKTNDCYYEIKGFRYLPKEKQKKLVNTLASHLKKHCE